MKKKSKSKIIKSSGNVFKDLGLPNADELLAEADRRIRKMKKQSGYDVIGNNIDGTFILRFCKRRIEFYGLTREELEELVIVLIDGLMSLSHDLKRRKRK